MSQISSIPTIEWYISLSHERGVGHRCPFASVKWCPRYYLSTWVLKKIDKQPQDKKLHSEWEKSELYPSLTDDFPSAAGGRAYHYGKFCPEVAFERFGYFVSELTEYFDALEQYTITSKLKDDAPIWKQKWLDLKPRHYTECPLYSLLIHSSPPLGSGLEVGSTKKEEESAFNLKPGVWGMSVDLHKLWRSIRVWFDKKNSSS